MRRVFRVVVVAEVALIAVLGIWTVRNEHIWYGDELVHLSITKYVADHGRLPVLGVDVVSQEVMRLDRAVKGGEIVCAPHDPNRATNLCGIYEAFQPPLYYLVTVPVYALGRSGSLDGSPHRALMLMRASGVVLLLAAVVLMMLLVREIVGPDRAPSVAALTLLVFLFPGTIVRFVIVANASLEIPLALGLTWLLWRAWTRDAAGALVAAAAVFGLCLLTKLTLAPLAVPLGVIAGILAYRRRTRLAASVGLAACVLLLPILMLAPWLAFNQCHYGAWTANDLARRIQAPALNPTNRPYPWEEISGSIVSEFERIPTPQEWGAEPETALPRVLRAVLLAILLGVPMALALVRACRRRFCSVDIRGFALLVAPLPLTMLLLAVETHSTRSNLILARYFLFTIPPVVVWASVQWQAVLGAGRRYLALVSGTGVLTLMLWVILAPRIP